MRISHVITALEVGGAESMLHRLLATTDPFRFTSQVISIAPPGPMAAPIEALGIPVRTVNVDHPADVPLGITRLARMLREDRTDLVQTWMYHADLVGGLAAKLAGGIPTVWNIRHGKLDAGDHKRTTILTAQACARLSRTLPTQIVSCSRAAVKLHADRGYDRDRMLVIPNGFDVNAFRPDPEARRAVRQELGLPDDAFLIGYVARFDLQKDFQNFFQAAARLQHENPKAHFVLCGDSMTSGNTLLMSWLEDQELRSRCHFLGRREDMPRLQASFDIATLTSRSGEGFPNVLGEAMACGVPCVTTDVGDAAWIVGDTGRIVPPGNPKALDAAWASVMHLAPEERDALGRAARNRIQERFALHAIVRAYETLYEDVLQSDAPGSRSPTMTLDRRHA